jgi:putative endonuclease
MVEQLPVKELVVGSSPTTGAKDFMTMYYVYVIKSLAHNTRYTGSTDDVENRLNEHNLGKCRYTSGRKPWRLVYKEKYPTRSKAIKREKFLKSGQGRKYLDNLLK